MIDEKTTKFKFPYWDFYVKLEQKCLNNKRKNLLSHSESSTSKIDKTFLLMDKDG